MKLPLALTLLLGSVLAPLSAQTVTQLDCVLADTSGTSLPVYQPDWQYDVSADGRVFFKLNAGFAPGRYYVQATSEFFELLSTDPANHRAWDVTVVNGRFVVKPVDPTNPVLPGSDAAGNQTIPLGRYKAPSVGDPCTFKAWLCTRDDFGDFATANDTYGIYFRSFKVGSGQPVNVCGAVFLDLDEDGVRDAGEPGLEGCKVLLTSTSHADLMTLSKTDGSYCFLSVPAGDWQAVLVVPSGYRGTTPTSFPVSVGACTDVKVPAFGKSRLVMNCSGHTPGYWRNKHGLKFIADNNMLAKLNAMACLRNEDGTLAQFNSLAEYKSWMKGGKATNMAYMLSIQWTAMFLNVERGFVSSFCLVETSFGNKAISAVMVDACNALRADGMTKAGDPNRAVQEVLKNILDDANNNRNWVN